MHFFYLSAFLLNLTVSVVLLVNFFTQKDTATFSKNVGWVKLSSSIVCIIFIWHPVFQNYFYLTSGILAFTLDAGCLVLLYKYRSPKKNSVTSLSFYKNKKFEELWESNPSYLSVKDIKIRYYKDESWVYQSPDGKYRTTLGIAEGNIFIEQAEGEVNLENTKAGLHFIEETVKYMELDNREYYYIADATKISKASLDSRKLVVEFHERNRNLKQFILVTNGFTRVLLKLMYPINPEVINNWITSDTIENALNILFHSPKISSSSEGLPETLTEKRIDEVYAMISKMSLRKFDEIEPAKISADDPFYGVFTALEILKNDNRETISELNTLLDNNNETLKEQELEILNAKYDSLKSQINPHFLFNSLNVLTELIYKNQDEAANFVKELSVIYRYILKYMHQELVTVSTEIGFMKSFSYLLKIRYNDSLNIHIDFGNKEDFFIPPLTLQLLVENCIKHNVATVNSPLNVTIRREDLYLVVSNNLQVKNVLPDSSKIGLKSIQGRYKYLSDKPVYIISDDKNFTVKLPLLKMEEGEDMLSK